MPTENTETTVQNNESVSSVWPLTQFFSVSFLYKITDWPGGQTPRRGKVVFFHSSQQLLRLRLEPLEGQRHRGPRPPSKTADANLDCEFVEITLFNTDP